MPQSLGSGCFVNYKGILIFLTGLHAVKAKEEMKYGIVVDFDLKKAALIYSRLMILVFVQREVFHSNATL